MIRRKKCFVFLLVALFLVLFLQNVLAADFNHIVINSEEWTDVYSGLLYASLEDLPADFLTSEAHSSIILEALDKNKDLMIFTSSRNPYVFNYPDLFVASGYNSAEEISAEDLNLRLIEDFPDINNFVIVSDLYGYNSVAVAPYAIQTDSWVFFADESNIDQIDEILLDRDVENVLIYGYVDREVREILEKYNPETVNNGNRFDDNIEIVEKFLEVEPTKQCVLTNGEFIELELLKGRHPVLFTGRDNVPEPIKNYLVDSPIEIGVLVGNELIGAATNIRESTGISVMVKFARGARTQVGGIAAVEGLDLFPLPTPILGLEVYSVNYNILTNNLEVTYKSSSNLPIYIRGTITITDGDNNFKLGDKETIFINPENYKTVVYNSDEFSDLKGFVPSEDAEAEVFVTYGERESALDRILQQTFPIKTVEVSDGCNLEIRKVSYYTQEKQFRIRVKNLADVDCYAQGALKDVMVDLEEQTLGSNDIIKIEPGKSENIYIEEELSDADIEDNEFVTAIVNYGQRETSLVKTLRGEFELNIVSIGTVTYVSLVLLLLTGIFLGIFFYKRKKEKQAFDFD